MSEKIVVIQLKEQVYKIDKKRIVIGSSTASDVKLSGEGVSPIHAIIESQGPEGSPVIYDLASDTGITINGKKTVQSNLSPTDAVVIGGHSLTVQTKNLNEIKALPERVYESFGKKLFVNEKEDLAPLILVDERDVIEIFDRRQESKQSLQVVMFYKDTILDVEHFINKKRVVIGPGKKEDFRIPPFFGHGKSGDFELVTFDKSGQYSLHLHPQMKGVLSHEGQLTPVQNMMTQSQAKDYVLKQKDFAKIQINDLSFFLNYTQAPPKLKRPRFLETDPFFAKIWFLSLTCSLLMMFTFSQIHVEPTIEIEQLPERVATIIYEPRVIPQEKQKVPVQAESKKEEPKQVTPPKPKVITVTPKTPQTPAPKNAMIGEKKPEEKQASKAPPKEVAQKTNTSPGHRASGQEGEGAKAKGPEGSRGKPNAPKSNVAQDKALRPGEGKPTNQASSNKGNSQTQDLGVVDIFKSNKGTLSKVLSGGSGVSNAANKLEGYSGFTTQGAGGLGAEGSGSGGGGQSMGLGGLSNKGIGGGKKGSGLGALGSGGNILGGKGKIAIDTGGAGEPVIVGAIDEDAIARAINQYRDQIKYCYEKEINAEHPDMSGRVAIRFVIGASGTVSSAGVQSSSLKNANTESCVVEVIKRIPFPPVRGGGVVDVTYPFLFKPSNK